MSWLAATRFRPAYRKDRRYACRSVRPKGDCRFQRRSVVRLPEAGCRRAARTLKHIADVQLASQLLYVHRFSLEREGRVARNYERAVDARQVCGQALGDT